MKTDTELPENETTPGLSLRRRIFRRPGTRLGWWSVGLAAAFVVLMIINGAVFMRLPEDVTWRGALLPFYGIFMLLCGLAALVVSLIAILRQHERSWLVWLVLLIGLNPLFLVLGEFIVPH